MTIFIISIIFILLTAAGLISATETAITAASPGRIEQLVREGNKAAILLRQMLKIKDRIISTLLIGNSLANTLCTTMATSLFIEFLGDDLGTIVSSVVMSIVIIVFSEVIPKAIAVAKPEQVSLMAVSGLNIFMIVLSPVNWLLNKLVRLIFIIFRIDTSSVISGSDEVRGVIEHQLHEGNVFKDDRDMLGGILDIRKMVVGDIMTHRSKLASVDINMSSKDIIDFALNCQHTRIPVYQDKADNIIGILHIRDLLTMIRSRDDSNYDIKSLLNEPWFIPDSALVTMQLQLFRSRKSHLACVVDEYGELEGIITLEDILEEIVGQIYDEHDKQRNKIVKLSEKEYTIDGSIPIRDLNRELGWNLPEGEASTIAGFMIEKMHKIPAKGESIIYNNYKIIAKTKSSNRIKTIKIFLLNK